MLAEGVFAVHSTEANPPIYRLPTTFHPPSYFAITITNDGAMRTLGIRQRPIDMYANLRQQ